MCSHPPASHPRRAVLSDIVRCIICGDKVKEINEGERYVVLPCDGPICQWCELRDSWGSHWDTCAGGIAKRTHGSTIRIFRAPPTPPPGTFSNRFDGPADRERAALAAMTIRALIDGPKADI